MIKVEVAIGLVGVEGIKRVVELECDVDPEEDEDAFVDRYVSPLIDRNLLVEWKKLDG